VRPVPDRPDAPDEPCRESPAHGCPRCCPRCDADEHRCPGCGAPATHLVGVCLRCRREHADDGGWPRMGRRDRRLT
jgi:hypothetical protein